MLCTLATAKHSHTLASILNDSFPKARKVAFAGAGVGRLLRNSCAVDCGRTRSRGRVGSGVRCLRLCPASDGDISVDVVMDALLPLSDRLVQLEVSRVGVHGAPDLCRLLSTQPRLKTLRVQCTSLGSMAAPSLVPTESSCDHHHHLESLHLSADGSGGSIELTAALPRLPCLSELRLSGSALQVDVPTLLHRVAPALRHLSLSDCHKASFALPAHLTEEGLRCARSAVAAAAAATAAAAAARSPGWWARQKILHEGPPQPPEAPPISVWEEEAKRRTGVDRLVRRWECEAEWASREAERQRRWEEWANAVWEQVTEEHTIAASTPAPAPAPVVLGPQLSTLSIQRTRLPVDTRPIWHRAIVLPRLAPACIRIS